MQLAKIDRVIASRLKNFRLLHAALGGVSGITLPAGIDSDHGCHLYVIRIDTEALKTTREAFAKHLKDEWLVGTAIHYPAVWSWEAFAGTEYDNSKTPVTHKACEQVLSLPLFPSSQQEDVDYLAHAIRETIAHFSA